MSALRKIHPHMEFINRRARDEYGKKIHLTDEYAANPHKAILDFVEPYLDDIKLSADKLLVATYRRPAKTEGGIHLTDSNLEEDKFQGAAGLVLKVGPAAFVEDAKTTFKGFKVEALDWITYRPVHGSAREIAGLHCRFLQDLHVDAVISDPTLVW
jgi:co-chaperonin GroES (HSP10)